MAATPQLDEIVWRGNDQEFAHAIHSNSILFYFAMSPFFDTTSNNAVLFQQGMNNAAMAHFLGTRELFEGRLREMSGLEFMVAQEPAESGPGMGTGVWVINKQTRRKRQGEDDDITVRAIYFVVDRNVYMGPSLAELLSSRMATISLSIAKVYLAAEAMQTWCPALGRKYKVPSEKNANNKQPVRAGLEACQAPSPVPDSTMKPEKTAPAKSWVGKDAVDARLMWESIAIHAKYGGDYMDLNPIIGKPGAFHFTSSGRKPDTNKKLLAVPGNNSSNKPLDGPGVIAATLPLLKIPSNKARGGEESPLQDGNARETKSPKSPSLPKPKRRKSKLGTTPP